MFGSCCRKRSRPKRKKEEVTTTGQDIPLRIKHKKRLKIPAVTRLNPFRSSGGVPVTERSQPPVPRPRRIRIRRSNQSGGPVNKRPANNKHRQKFRTVMVQDDELGCCQKPFIIYVFDLAVFLKLMCGVLFLFLSCYLYILRSDYVPLLHNQNYMFCVFLMAGAGLLILFNGCLSCSAMNSRLVLCVYTLMLIVILAMQLVLSYTSFVYSQMADDEVATTFPQDLKFYRNDSYITRAIDVLQFEGRCCGALGFEDYRGYEPEGITYEEHRNLAHDINGEPRLQYVPDSCCRSVSNGCGKSDHPSNIHYHGCLRFLQRQVKQHIYMIFTLALSGTILQVFAILVTFGICIRKISKSKERRKQEKISNGKKYFQGNRAPPNNDLAFLE